MLHAEACNRISMARDELGVPVPATVCVEELFAAALRRTPVDLAPLVAASRVHPGRFDEDMLQRLVRLLNDDDTARLSEASRVGCLDVLGNIALDYTRRDNVLEHLSSISRWFDRYLTLAPQGGDPAGGDDQQLRVLGSIPAPRLHMSMLVRCSSCRTSGA